jgi:hypothetical protein
LDWHLFNIQKISNFLNLDTGILSETIKSVQAMLEESETLDEA